MSRKAFVDFDGTIVNVYHRYFTILNEFLISRNCPLIQDENAFIELKRKGTKDHLIVKILSPFPSDEDFPIEDYLVHKRKRLEQREYLQLDSLIGDPFLAYQQLKIKGYSVIVVSKRRNPEGLKWQIESFCRGICDEFFCVMPEKNKNVKYEALKGMVGKGDFIVGDSSEDMEAGKLLKIDSYFVQSGLSSLEQVFSEVRQFLNYNEVVDWLSSSLS